jgi:hypothetical protein
MPLKKEKMGYLRLILTVAEAAVFAVIYAQGGGCLWLALFQN